MIRSKLIIIKICKAAILIDSNDKTKGIVKSIRTTTNIRNFLKVQYQTLSHKNIIIEYPDNQLN